MVLLTRWWLEWQRSSAVSTQRPRQEEPNVDALTRLTLMEWPRALHSVLLLVSLILIIELIITFTPYCWLW